MRIILLGGAGFIGTNLALELGKCTNSEITLVDEQLSYFNNDIRKNKHIKIKESKFNNNTDFDELLSSQDIVYHLFSSTVPTTSNQHIEQEININVVVSIRLLEACVRQGIKKVVFISSGGTVYGKNVECPIKEDTPTNPINAYGIQKITIEKLLYLYNHLYNLDYRIVRLSNPYGPYQRPNGILGAVTTFTYKALNKQEITVYGRGDVVRDYIYIDDAIEAILKVVNGESEYKTFNIGSGIGTSLNELIAIIKDTLRLDINVNYVEGRKSDVMTNYLDVTRFIGKYGDIYKTTLQKGVLKTAEFLRRNRY